MKVWSENSTQQMAQCDVALPPKQTVTVWSKNINATQAFPMA